MLRLDHRFRLRRARQPATFARSGFRKQLERLRHQPLLDAGEMHIDDRAHGVGVVGEADVVDEAAAQESVGQLLLVVRRDHHDRPPPRFDGFAGLKSKNPAAPAVKREAVGKGTMAMKKTEKTRTHFTFRIDTWTLLTARPSSITWPASRTTPWRWPPTEQRSSARPTHADHVAAGRPCDRGQPVPASGGD